MGKLSRELASVLAFVMMAVQAGHAAPVALFVFGDSLVEAGNNNYIPSTARSNFRPHGLDYGNGVPTGRFSNGKIIPDFLCDYLGVPPLKPCLDPSNDESNLIIGSNFASAGAGILNTTGRLFVTVLTVEKQFTLFKEYKQKVAGFIGEAEMEKLVSNALYLLNFGGNDYLNNYYEPTSVSSLQYTPQQWQDLLISAYKGQLRQLYDLGARKFSIFSLGPLGCAPFELNSNSSPDGTCIENMQQVLTNFNAALKAMTEQLNAELRDATFVYGNCFDIVMDYIPNPVAHGFDVSNTACCGYGKYNALFPCTILSNLCPDRTKYVFWDWVHPTERVNGLITQRVLNGPTSDISPINVRQLLGI